MNNPRNGTHRGHRPPLLLRCIALLLAALLFGELMAPLGAAADEPESPEEILVQNTKNAVLYAESFVEVFTQSADYAAGSSITMRDAEDNVSGFCVDILKNQSPSGYVVVKFADGEPVVSEFCLEEGAPNPFDEQREHYGIVGDELTFYSIGPNDYQIYDPSTQTVYGSYGQVFTAEEFAAYKAEAAAFVREEETDLQSAGVLPDTAEGMELIEGEASLTGEPVYYTGLDGYSVISNSYLGTVKASKTITGADRIDYYATRSVSNAGLTYACTVVAVSNLMKYLRSRGYTNIPATFKPVYTALWKLLGTFPNGDTRGAKIPGAAKSYLKNIGYRFNDTNLYGLYTLFMAALENNRPCIFDYGAIFDGERSGHTVFVVGYVFTTSYHYLKIADGWNRYLRYINHNGYNYRWKKGWAFYPAS